MEPNNPQLNPKGHGLNLDQLGEKHNISRSAVRIAQSKGHIHPETGDWTGTPEDLDKVRSMGAKVDGGK